MGFREGIVRDEILLMIGMFFGNVFGGRKSFEGRKRVRRFYEVCINAGKIGKAWNQLWDNNFVRNRMDASGWLFQEREVNLLLFITLFITTPMFIFYAIGIHERASWFSTSLLYFEKNIKIEKLSVSDFSWKIEILVIRRKVENERINKIIHHSINFFSYFLFAYTISR